MPTNEAIVGALAPLAQQYGYDPQAFVPRALETLEALADADDADGDLGGLKLAELQAVAEAEGVSTDGTKAELRERIEAARADGPD